MERCSVVMGKTKKKRADSNRQLVYSSSFYIKMSCLDTPELWMRLPGGAANMGGVQDFASPWKCSPHSY